MKKVLIALAVAVALGLLVVVGVGIYASVWYNRMVDDQPSVQAPAATPEQVKNVNNRIERIDQSLRRGEPVEEEFTVEDANIAIHHGKYFTALRDKIVVKKVIADVATIEASIPSSEDGKQFINCEVDVRASVTDGQFTFSIVEARSVEGKKLPAKVVKKIEDYALSMVTEDPDVQREMKRIERLEIRDGNIFFRIAPQ